ncbi:tetratricopeptide repeat protein [Glaciecola siphonariae]|uniref:Tetratricopeptide repeat protein n=1 Tax=Glaciecola siphonariae TaxID=521012 RepID=A0ABV9LXA0_9ALTE
MYDNAQIGYKHTTSNAYLKDTPVIRMDYQAGAIEFVMPVFDDDLNIVDFFIGSRGNFSSIGVARMASLMSKPSGPQLESLFDINFVDASLVGAIGEIVGAYSQNEFALAYEKLEALPPEVKNTRALLDFAVGLAQTVSEEQYIEKLSALYEHHGDDPSAAFVLIDYHFYNQDFEKVLASIDSAMILVGKDGALLHLKGAYLVMMGLDKQGRAFVEESIEVDPELMSAYWTLASIQNQAKEFEQLTQTLATIESQFDLSIKPEELRANPGMADYVKSEAFKNAFPGG